MKTKNHWEFLKKETEFFFESTDFDFILNRIEEKLSLGYEKDEEIYNVGLHALNRPLNKMLKDVKKLARLFMKVDTNLQEEFLILFSRLVREKELKINEVKVYNEEKQKIIGADTVKARITIDIIVNFLTEVSSIINYDDYKKIEEDLKEKLLKCFTH